MRAGQVALLPTGRKMCIRDSIQAAIHLVDLELAGHPIAENLPLQYKAVALECLLGTDGPLQHIAPQTDPIQLSEDEIGGCPQNLGEVAVAPAVFSEEGGHLILAGALFQVVALDDKHPHKPAVLFGPNSEGELAAVFGPCQVLLYHLAGLCLLYTSELAKYIAQELGVELEIHPMDFDSVLASVTENKCDMAISGIASKPERAEKMDFSTPYKNKQENSQGIMILSLIHI